MKKQNQKRFTLIEMLVVIAIIFILAGLVFPATARVRERAKMSRAHTECSTLKTAVIQYEAEFACWPAKINGSSDGIVSSGDYPEMCKRLAGNNTKKLYFFEPGSDYKESEGFLDPWGNQYIVILDANFDNKIDSDAWRSAAFKTNATDADKYLHQRVGVYSYGQKGTDLVQGKVVTSWK